MRSLPPHDAAAAVRQGALVVDVRAPAVFARDAVAGSVNLPLDDLEQGTAAATWDPARQLLVVCEYGAVSELAALLLESEGFTDVAHVRGGLAALRPLLADDNPT